MSKMKPFSEMLTEDEIRVILSESSSDLIEEIEFESFLRVSWIESCCLYVYLYIYTLEFPSFGVLKLNFV